MEPINNQTAKKEYLTYHQMSLLGAISTALLISIALAFIWFKFGHVSNHWLVIYPRDPKSLTAIITSNFLHGSKEHLYSNLIIFIPTGIWALKQEGWRAVYGMFMGVIFAGIATWIYGTRGSAHLGFSGVVFSLYGILLISSIRRLNIILLLILFIFLQWLGSSFFDALRPTEFTDINHLSWIGHLGGFVGGIWSQLNDSSIALETLLKNEDITPEEYNLIAGRICIIEEKSIEEVEATANEEASTQGSKDHINKESNQKLDPTVKTPAESGNEQGTAGQL
jgi:membrane associated rhomboid family serine protease